MEEHTTPPSPERSLPRMTRGALLRGVGGGAGTALAAATLLSAPHHEYRQGGHGREKE
jgi:hypothetical protein